MKYNVHSRRGRIAINPNCASQSDLKDERIVVVQSVWKETIRCENVAFKNHYQ